jgi:hypothetical protein
MNFNSPDLAPSATEEANTRKEIEAAACRFVEYRGEGKPVRGNPPANPGDVYFDLKEQPYSIWVCQPDSGWNQWMSMSESRNCKHPNKDCILSPSVKRLAWVPITGYDSYLRQTRLRLGRRTDAADTHIKIILDYERGVKPPPPQAPPSPDRVPSPDHSIDDDNEVTQLMIEPDSVNDVPRKSEVEIMMEVRADLENRCRMMRVQNENIRKAISTSPRT